MQHAVRAITAALVCAYCSPLTSRRTCDVAVAVSAMSGTLGSHSLQTKHDYEAAARIMYQRQILMLQHASLSVTEHMNFKNSAKNQVLVVFVAACHLAHASTAAQLQ